MALLAFFPVPAVVQVAVAVRVFPVPVVVLETVVPVVAVVQAVVVVPAAALRDSEVPESQFQELQAWHPCRQQAVEAADPAL